MNLYQLGSDFRQLFDGLDEITENSELTAEQQRELEQAWFDTLEGVEGEFDEKAEAIAVRIKELAAEADILKAEKYGIDERMKAKVNTAERLKNYLLDAMNLVGRTKIDRPRAKITVCNNPQSVNFEDEIKFIKWAAENECDELLKYALPTINKNAVKKYLQDGNKINGVKLVRTQSVRLK